MSDPINDFVSVTVTINSVGVARQDFDTLAILTHDAPWTDRSRDYSSTADATGDGFGSGHPVYRALSRALGQTPAPRRVKVIRTTSPVQMSYAIAVNSVKNTRAYAVDAKGQVMADATATYTSDSDATNDEIAENVSTQLNAVTGREFTSEVVGSPGSETLSVYADAALVYADKVFTADATSNAAAATAHGLLTGDGPLQVSNAGGFLPAGLVAVTNYWIVRVDADHFKFATSRANALANSTVDLTTNGTGTQTISDTASTRTLAPNKWFSLAVNAQLLTLTQTQAAPAGLGTDLDDIVLEDNAWFGLVTPYGGSAAYVLAADTWVSANARIYFADTADSTSETLNYADDTNCAKQLAAAGSYHTVGVYHRDPSSFLGAASLARWLTTIPGKSVVNLKPAAGVVPLPLSTTGFNNLKAKFCSTYVTVRGVNGFIDNGLGNRTYRWIDVTRNLLWLVSAVQAAVFGDMAAAELIGYDQAGIQRVEGKVRAVLEAQAVPQGVLAGGVGKPVVTAPDIADVPEQDKEDRVLNNVAFSGTLLGAVYSVAVDGSVVF